MDPREALVEDRVLQLPQITVLETARSLFALSLRDLDGATRLEFGCPPWEGFALFLLQVGDF